MDPITIAAGVVALLSPFVRKAADEFAGDAGKLVWTKTEQLVARLKARLSGDVVAQQTLSRFEQDPSDGKQDLQSVLADRLDKDSQLRDEMAKLLTDIKQVGPHIKVVQRVKDAEKLTGVDAHRMSRGTLDVNQEADQVKDATGVKIDEIGS